MTGRSDGQVPLTAAQIYEDFFVPALFREWAPQLVQKLAPEAGAKCLDVACGTGVLARELARRVGPEKVVGLDRNQGMLALAQQLLPLASWKSGRAEDLPFETEAFDAVGCQFALMFFTDRSRALTEMWRVLKPGGRLVVAVWGPVEETPGYASMIALLHRLFGAEIADELRAPFSLGDRTALAALLEDAGLPVGQIETRVGRARFPSIASWVHTDIRGWTLAEKINDDELWLLEREAERSLEPHVVNGRVEFDSPAHIVALQKPNT